MNDQGRYEDIPHLVRDLREAAGRTQGQFADEVSEYGRSVTRYTVNRIENGHVPVDRELAAALDAFAESKHLRVYGFLSRLTQLKAHSVDGKRGTHLARVLSAGDLTDIYVVMCDETNFAFHVRSGLAAGAGLSKQLAPARRRLTLVIPSNDRLANLFGGEPTTTAVERVELYDGYAARLVQHMNAQLQRFRRIAQQSQGVELEVFESDAVLNSVVLTKGAGESKCVYWPCTPLQPGGESPGVVPVAAGSDMTIWYESLIKSMIDVSRGVARRQYLGDVSVIHETPASEKPVDDSEPEEHSRPALKSEIDFSRCLPVDKVARYDMGENEGLAVASVLPVVRAVHGGELTAEVLLKRRSQLESGVERADDSKLAFVSSRVRAWSMWDAIGPLAVAPGVIDGGAGGSVNAWRLDMSKHVDDQSADVHHALRVLRERQSSGAEGNHGTAIVDNAYRNAAAGELALTYGLDRSVASWAARLEPGGLDDCGIVKSESGGIVPRLYIVRLNPEERDKLESLAQQNDGDEVVRVTADLLIDIIDHGQVTRLGQVDDFLRFALTGEELRGQFRDLLIRLKNRANAPEGWVGTARTAA